jgi:hypothetical protein
VKEKLALVGFPYKQLTTIQKQRLQDGRQIINTILLRVHHHQKCDGFDSLKHKK